MGYVNGLDKDAFLQHMFEEFPSVFNNSFAREMLVNIVDYGTVDNFTHTKNELYYFLKDIIPEMEPKDLIPFMDKAMLTDEVLREVAYSRIDFTAGYQEWNVAVDGERLYSFEVDSDNFDEMDSEGLKNFIEECVNAMQEEFVENGLSVFSDEELDALKGRMFDVWKYHFDIEDKKIDDLIADATAVSNEENRAEKTIEKEKDYE